MPVFQLPPECRLGIAVQVADDGGVVSAKIRLKPAIYAGNPEFAGLHAGTARVVDIVARPLLQQGLGVFGAECPRLQVGAAERRAVEGVVQARVLPYGTQDTVFDIVQADLPGLYLEAFFAPGPIGEPAR